MVPGYSFDAAQFLCGRAEAEGRVDSMVPHLQSSLTRSPIDRLPCDDVTRNAIATFLDERARGWSTVPAVLSAAESGALWALFALNVAMGAWLAAAQAGTPASAGPLGTIVTLGGHPTITLALALTCVATLVVAMPMTRGLTRASGPMLGVVTAAAFCGVVATAGVIAVLVAVALCLAVALGVLLVFFDRL